MDLSDILLLGASAACFLFAAGLFATLVRDRRRRLLHERTEQTNAEK